MGPFIVGLYVVCPQHIGFSATFIGGISGYLASSVVFDHFGIFGVEKTEITLWKGIGVTSVLFASVLVNVDKRGKSKADALETKVQLTITRLDSTSRGSDFVPDFVPTQPDPSNTSHRSWC